MRLSPSLHISQSRACDACWIGTFTQSSAQTESPLIPGPTRRLFRARGRIRGRKKGGSPDERRTRGTRANCTLYKEGLLWVFQLASILKRTRSVSFFTELLLSEGLVGKSSVICPFNTRCLQCVGERTICHSFCLKLSGLCKGLPLWYLVSR